MEIQCCFKYNNNTYGCYIENHQIPEDKELKIIGEHSGEETNQDVSYVEFVNCTLTKFPKQFLRNFPNLKSLYIKNSKLKRLCKNDLEDLKGLEKFECPENDLEFLPGDLFQGFKNLETINFSKNKIEVIEPNIFEGLDKLKYYYFQSNKNYDTSSQSYQLQNFKEQINEKFFALDKKFIFNFFNKFILPVEEIKRYAGMSAQNKIKILDLLLTYVQKKYEHDLKKLQVSENRLKFENQQLKKFDFMFYNDIKNFIQDEDSRDFKIQIEDHEFPVHKFLLAARSPTLAELIKNNPAVENLKLVEIPVEIFESILKFIYNDELPRKDGANYFHLFAAAGKLKIEELKNFTASKVLEQISGENAIEIFKLGHKYEHEEMRTKAFEEIKKSYGKIKFQDEWAVEPDKVSKLIEKFRKKEEAIRKIEEEFERSIANLEDECA